MINMAETEMQYFLQQPLKQEHTDTCKTDAKQFC